MAILFSAPDRLRRIGWIWLLAALLNLAVHVLYQTGPGLTDGQGHPFGDDALNFWAAARLAFDGRAADAYDLAAFHAFQTAEVGAEILPYHNSYPPVLMLLTWPFGGLPYLAFWALWLLGGWVFFALCLRPMLPRYWALYAAAFPAVMVDFIGGQAACWLAGIFGCGLHLLSRRPVLAGLVFSLAIFKPQLVWLVPFALLAARQWRALGGFAGGSVALLAATTLAFGPDIWPAYARQGELLRRFILEDGEGVWHRMISAFVLLRHLGASTAVAYAVQAAVSFAIAALVIMVWHSSRPQATKNVVLILGTILGAPYVSDYDLVLTAFVPVWLLGSAGQGDALRVQIATALLVAAPVAAAALALGTGAAIGGALLLPALWLAAGRRGPGLARTHLAAV